MTDAADENRPDPEALLEQTKKEKRGRLKVFLGMAPGVGKTYAMLRAAHQKIADGKDIAVAIAETHGRKETLAMLEGLEILPRKLLRYREKDFEEMDIDAVLARRPAIALVDELAHTNIEGSRHSKRYQDVEELLDAGINVYTTLNIQHLESLNDIIERITKVKVQETLPDAVLQTADEIEMIDLSPDDLLQRLREGKVYLGDMAQRAMDSFFARGNLTALREMALRTAAERVDRDVSEHMKTHGVSSIWPTHEKLLVCIDESGNAETLIRMGARMAARARTPWIVLYVETNADAHLTENEKDIIAEALSMAEKLGGEAATVRGGTNIAADILAFARSRNMSRILIGRHGKSWISNVLFPSVSDQIVASGNEFDITLLHATARDKNESGLWRRFFALSGQSHFKDYVEATLAIMCSLAAALLLQGFLPLPNLTMIFLVGVLFSAVRSGLWPSLYCAFVSSLTINFFFTEPLYTFSVYSQNDMTMLIFFTIVAVFTGNLAVRLKDQIEALQVSARRNATMLDFSRKLSVALTLDDVIREAVENTSESFDMKTMLIIPDEQKEDQLMIVGIEPLDSRLEKIDWAAAEWAFKNDKPAGLGCDTLPAASWLFKPLRSPQGLLGLIAISPNISRDGDAFDTPEQRRMLYAFCDQIALALERAKLTVDIEASRLQNETERLRTALLSSVSHDLRTPLASIMGSATTLTHMDGSLSNENRTDLVQNILQESERLNRFVQNLLDMTKLGHGTMEPKREWVSDIRDILGRATSRLQKTLMHYKVEYKIDDNVANFYVDPVLIEQVMVNILENAAKYSPAGTRIQIIVEKAKDGASLRISDQGQGIPEADREKVFDMFYRVRAGDSKVAGTGLGLAICRGIIAAHGGTIHAEAGFMGKGTVIVIQFPANMVRSKTFYREEKNA
jgi:two-component system, OmpR family, sensor histidine kinase KdpD